MPGSSSTIDTPNVNTSADGPQTTSFDLAGVTLSANTDYTLFNGVADSDGPAGNNTSFDAFVLNGDVVSDPSSGIQIREIGFDPDANTVTLAWDSQPGETFFIRFSTDLIDWTADLNDSQLAVPEGTTTTQEFDLTDTAASGLPAVFFRVEK